MRELLEFLARSLVDDPAAVVVEQFDDDDGTVDGEDSRPLDDQVFPGAPDSCDGVDSDCDGSADEECPMTRICMVNVNLNGDCVTTRCPADCPYPVGCDITMAGGDARGCVASTPRSPVVYFQEGDVCGAGRVTGTLRCSNVPGTGLNASNCPINKPQRIYPASRSGCPAT